MQTETALVGTDCGVELYAVTAIHLHLAIIIDPCNTEGDESFRLNESFDDPGFNYVGACCKHRLYGFKNFLYCLYEFGLSGVAFFNTCNDFCNIILAVFHFSLLVNRYKST